MTSVKHICLLILSLLCSGTLLAQNQTQSPVEAGEYLIHHSLFNSSFLTPEVASAYNITRGANNAILNIAVTKAVPDSDSYGLPAGVTGVARNLMQQRTELEFIEVREANAVYYIAPIEFDDQEVMHFDIEVILPGQQRATSLSFSKKLYKD